MERYRRSSLSLEVDDALGVVDSPGSLSSLMVSTRAEGLVLAAACLHGSLLRELSLRLDLPVARPPSFVVRLVVVRPVDGVEPVDVPVDVAGVGVAW